ncbi:MAG TPA: trypsin-like serine protease [Jatrophihabitantaceae bacterium]|jgi:hypothetical protein
MLSASRAEAIAHGTPALPGQYRFATKLTMTNIPRPDGSHYNSACSAALISPRWIITAGHVVRVDRADNLVRPGAAAALSAT